MVKMIVIIFVLQRVKKCFLSAMCVLTLMTERITTQEYAKMQIVDTETTEHTLILLTS